MSKVKKLVFILLFLLKGFSNAETAQKPIIGPVTVGIGVGCSFSTEDKTIKDVFVENFTEQGIIEGAWVNVGGKNIKLKQINKTTWPQNGKSSTLKYKAGKIEVVLKVKQTSPGGEKGQMGSYKGRMEVLVNGMKQDFNIAGFCGC